MESLPIKKSENIRFKLYVFDFGTLGRIVTRGRDEEEAKRVMFHDLDRHSPLYGSTYRIIDIESLPPDEQRKIAAEYERTHPAFEVTPPYILKDGQ